MNVGGHRLSNAELAGHFAEMGLGEVSTFRASGNVVFESAAKDTAELALGIEEGLGRALGYAVPVFLRAAGEIRRMAAHAPFDAGEVAAAAGKLQVGLLSAPPAAGLRESVLASAGEHERVALGETELYWLPSGGFLDSDLDLKALERMLGAMTWRTKGTVELIARKYFSE
jgi:uncharacterized protein (DUF1697 family)